MSGKCEAEGCDCECFDVVGKGFVLGTGNPFLAKMMLILEAPGKDEIQFTLTPVADRWYFDTREKCEAEVAIRKRAYKEIDERLLRRGAPVVGKSGVELDMWVLPAIGVKRHELFIDNTLRCLPPKVKERQYPTGDDRKMAEYCCRQYDRLKDFRPNAMVLTLHPAGILREVTPLPLQIKDFEKGRDFVKAGKRVAMLIGGMSAKAFLRYGESITKFRGDYRLLPATYLGSYVKALEFASKGEKVAKKKTAVEELFDLCPGAEPLRRPRKTKATTKLKGKTK